MKHFLNFLLFLSIGIGLHGQSCPSTIRVGTNCGSSTSCTPCSNTNCCHRCTGTVNVVSFDTYVKRVLAAEWYNCWGSQTGGMNSLQAGAVAIRSYSINRIAALASCHGSNYDICDFTCCQAYATNQYTNSNNAADNTANYVLVSGNTIQLSEHSAENNHDANCADGYKGNGTGSWPCSLDQPCTGQNHNGHGRGMCQNGSARWATGLNLVNSSCTWQSAHGYGTKTWQQILSHYYPNWTLTTCGAVPAPSCNNDAACSPMSLSINTSGNCSNTACSTINGTPPSPNISFNGGASCTSLYQTGRYDDDVWFSITPSSSNPITVRVAATSNTSNFDVAIGLYQGSCSNLTQVACADQSGVGVTENLNYTPVGGTTYLVRVFSYGIGSTYAGNFNICAFSSCTAPSQPGSITGASTVCQGTSQTYSIGSVSGATSYTWSYSGGGNPTGTGTSTTFSPTSSGTLSVVANNGCGSSIQRTKSITVNPVPSQPGSISGPTTVCLGSSQTYSIGSVSGATSYTWSYSGGGSPTGTGTSVTFSPTSSGTLSVVANNTCGSSSQRTLSITVGQALAQPGPISGNTTVCQGSSQNYSISSVTGATSYSWSYSGGGNPSGSGTSITFSPTSSGTLSVVANGSCGSSTPRTISITVSPVPTQPGSISGATTVCQGTSQGYSIASVSGATSYTWAYSGGGSPGGSGTSVTFSPTTSGTLSVTANNACGISSQRTLSITVTQTPAQPGSISGNTTACQGASEVYSIGAVSGATSYTWTLPSGWSGNSSTTSINVIPGNSGGSISVIANNSCGSSSPRSLNVTSVQIPSVSVNPPNVSICLGGNGVQLQATAGAQNYSWTPALGLSSTNGQTVTANPATTTTYTVLATSGNCSSSATSTVTVSSQITASISPSNPIICASDPVTLTSSPGTSYGWSGPVGFTASTQSITVSTPGYYNVVVTNPGGCNGSASATSILSQYPALNVDAGTNQSIQSGGSATIGGNPTASGGTPPYTYSWNPTVGLNNASIANPIATPTTSTTYNLIVTDAEGCTSTQSVSVTIGSNCTYVLDSLNMTIPASAGTYTMNLVTGVGCPWTVVEGCSWLGFTATSGNGSAVLEFTAQANTLSSPRTCFVNVEGNILVITQSGVAPCVAPVADFGASPQAGFAPLSIAFSDVSANSPTQWEWTFPGGNPSTSLLQNPSVSYPYGGLFDVTLRAINVCGSGTVTKSGYINVLGATSIENLDFSESFAIFPNPNHGSFRVVCDVASNNSVELNLFSALGQLLYSERLLPHAKRVDQEVTVPSVSAGIYVVQIVADKKATFKKLIIE